MTSIFSGERRRFSVGQWARISPYPPASAGPTTKKAEIVKKSLVTDADGFVGGHRGVSHATFVRETAVFSHNRPEQGYARIQDQIKEQRV